MHLKRLFDLCGAFLLLMVFSPAMLLIGCLIRLSSKGPVIYHQKRVGLENKVFTIYKFRTMEDRSEKVGIDVTSNGDPRITRIGRFLRSSRLDELPQLWNVIWGDMSLVGPHPYRPEIAKLISSNSYGYAKRTKMKPGVTGLAKVIRGNSKELDGLMQDLRYDILYVKKWSIAMDVVILLKTPYIMWKRTGI